MCGRSASASGSRAGRVTSRRRTKASRTSSSTCSSRAPATRSAEDIAQQVDSIGGQIDAFTSKEYAGYFIKVLDEHLPLAVDMLADLVTAPLVRRRRHRAREEGRPRRDQDGRGHARRSGPRDLRRFWTAIRSAVRFSAAARRSRRSIATTLSDYFADTYVAPEFRGRRRRQLEHARVRDLVERGLRGTPRRARPCATRRRPPPPRWCSRKKELEQSHVCFGAPALPQHHPDRYAAFALNTMLGGSMSSRLFQNVREKRGLAYSVFSGLSAYQDAGAPASTPAAPTTPCRADRRRRRAKSGG